MGTKAWVQFPVYKFEGYIDYPDQQQTVTRWGEKEGDIFIYTQYDGDILPVEVQKMMKQQLEQAFYTPNPMRWSAELLGVMYERVLGGSYYIMLTRPKEGYGMVVDVKEKTVQYLTDDRWFSFYEFVRMRTNLVFSA